MVGTVTLSVEIELGWGLARSGGPDPLERHGPERRAETDRLNSLLALCDELTVPISFDVVGHLLLDGCNGTHAGPHPAGWFDGDPGTDRRRDPLYYAPDLIDAVADARTDHELCTHSFSHARCDRVDDRVVDWELGRVADLHADRGIERPASFVPPVHAPPPAGVLRENGIRTVRRPVEYRPPVADPEPPSGAMDRLGWRLRRSHPVETLCRSPAVQRPRRRNGLTETYTSWHASLSAPYLRNGRLDPHPAYRAIPRSLRQRLHRRYLLSGLRQIARSGGSVHYWTHLFNLVPEAQWTPVRSFLEAVASYRDRGAVEVSPMVELDREGTHDDRGSEAASRESWSDAGAGRTTRVGGRSNGSDGSR